jgi:hypothetical protein
MIFSGKHSSLLKYRINCGCKNIYSTDPRAALLDAHHTSFSNLVWRRKFHQRSILLLFFVKVRRLPDFSGKEVVLPLENVGKPWARQKAWRGEYCMPLFNSLSLTFLKGGQLDNMKFLAEINT